MRKLLILTLLLFASPAFAADKGFNFRLTSGYVTDSAPDTYVLDGAGTTYPTTRNSVTFGWSDGTPLQYGSCIDRDTGVNSHFAGVCYVANGNENNFRIDLPSAGTYDIRLAIGDTGADRSAERQVVRIYDDTTLLTTIDKGTGPAQDHYYDATGVDQTEAGWAAGNTAYRGTFATTTLYIRLGLTTFGGYTFLAHASFEAVSAGGAAVRRRAVVY